MTADKNRELAERLYRNHDYEAAAALIESAEREELLERTLKAEIDRRTNAESALETAAEGRNEAAPTPVSQFHIDAVRKWLDGGCSSWGTPAQSIEALLKAVAARTKRAAALSTLAEKDAELLDDESEPKP